MMSTKNEAAAENNIMCASCGIAQDEVDVTLMKCACHLVKYCSISCQKQHRPQHKKACKKRLTEMRDEILFKQPKNSNIGDCPICCLPLSGDPGKSTMMGCCSKLICLGCDFANKKREIRQSLQLRCAFCREPIPDTEGFDEINLKRSEKNDPFALTQLGMDCLNKGAYHDAFEYITKAAELGNADAHYNLSVMYHEGKGVEKNSNKKIHHLEEAAIAGHLDARYNLGIYECRNAKFERAAKHFIIASNLGHHESLKRVISKDDYGAALRAYQARINEMKSSEREEAEAYYNFGPAGQAALRESTLREALWC